MGHSSSSVEDLKYHLVFATKYRYNLITPKIAEALKNYFIKQQADLNGAINISRNLVGHPTLREPSGSGRKPMALPWVDDKRGIKTDSKYNI